MAKTTVPGLYIADGAITAAKLSSSLDLSGVTITVATASTGDNDTTVASTAFVQQEIAALVDSSPSALNTLNELAAAIGDDASFSTTVTNSIATKLALAGGTMTGDLIINTTGSLQIPVGTTAQRPTAAQGQLRFNTTTSKPEIYNGSAWADVGGGVESVNSATGVVVLTTANIAENTNLYYTDARADARIAAADTDDLSEGSTNLYFTTARANSAIDGRLSGSTGVTVSNGAISIGQDVATSTSPTFQNLTLSGTDSVKVPSGTTAQRSGSPANGMLRYNSSTNEFEGYANSAWGAIGGDTTSSVDLYTATGNGSTATYDTGKNPQSENNTWVFIGGVYQPKSTYSFSGTEITLSENLPNGEDLEVITGTVSTYNPTDAILGQYNVTTSNTASYDTSLTTENENNVFVFIDGVYQPKSSYTYSGSTLTLDAVPTSGMSLEVLVTRSMNAATVTTGFLADDAVTTAKITDANVTAAKLASSLDLTGKTVTVATASAGDNDTSVASTAFVRQEITSLVDSAPAAMDTLNELAAALGDDANFSTTVNASIAAKLPLAGGTMTGDLILGDNVKIEIGSASGGDLQIYHDGSNSYVTDAGDGVLFIKSSAGVYLNGTTTDEPLARFIENGAVNLYYDNSLKFNTTSTGIDVTGTVVADGLTVEGDTLSMSHTGNTSTISLTQKTGTQNSVATISANREDTSSSASRLLLSTNNGTSTLQRMRINNGGDISFYEDTGTTAKLLWDASAESLGIGTTSPGYNLHVEKSSPSANVDLLVKNTGTDATSNTRIMSYVSGASGGDPKIGLGITGVRDYFWRIDNSDSDKLILDTNGTDILTIDSSGNVGIGVSSPAEKLHIRDSSTNADVYIKIANDSRDWFMGVEGSNSDILSFKTHDASNLLNITSSGNVGIGGTPDSSGRLLVQNGGTNQIVLTNNDSATTNLNMGNFSGGGYISQNYYYDSGHQADDNTKGAFEIFIGDDIYGINYHSAGAMGTRRRDFSITSAGNVGMGTNNPGFASGSGLEIERAGIATLRFQNTSSGKSVEITQDSDFKIESMNSASDILLMPTANVGIGTSSPTEKLHVYSGTGNVPAKFESGDAYSIITFADSGTSGTVGTGAQSNDLIFYSGDALRMRLSSGGVVSADGVYNTTTSDAANVRVLSNGNIVRSTSSERYKNTITDASKGLTELNNLRPVTYKGNNDGDTVFYGLIAEEVHEAGLTEFVEYNDANEPDALRYPHMVSLCIKAIQEQQTIIDDLKSRLDNAGL